MKQNVCLDTNTIISYLLMPEPQHTIIAGFIKTNNNNTYYYTEHIQREIELIFFEKYNLINSITNNFKKYLENHHNDILSLNEFILNFTKNNTKKYKYKGKIIDNISIERLLENLWYNKENKEILEGFELYNYVSDFLWDFNYELLNFKEDFLSKLILIKSHIHKHYKINKLLLDKGSHYEDNQIILDLYEYYLKYKITFVIVTFDNDFMRAIRRCNFKFIERITNLM